MMTSAPYLAFTNRLKPRVVDSGRVSFERKAAQLQRVNPGAAAIIERMVDECLHQVDREGA